MSAADSSQTAENSSQERQFPRRPPEIDKYVDAFLSTVCDTSRRYILELLTVPEDEEPMPEKRSGDIARAIGLSAATTSEHLRQLVQAGLLTSRRQGNAVYYQLRNHKLVRAFHALMTALDDDYALRLPADQE